MNNEIIVFGHNDLDMLGCMLNIEFKMPNVKKKYFHTNYSNIAQRVDEIEQYIAQNGNTHILIPDVSFADDKDSLRRLYNLGKCTHIDHHLYPEGFWDEFPDMKVVYDKDKCATKLCNEYFGNAGKHDGLDKLTYIIDIYDLWQTENKDFTTAQELDCYFWEYNIAYLLEKIIERGYKLPSNYLSVTEKLREKQKKDLESFEKRKLIHRSNNITICFVDAWFNQILIKEMEQGQHFVIGVNSYGIIRIRVNRKANHSSEVLDNIRLATTGTKTIGHQHAFTYKMDKVNSFENLINEIQSVVGKIEDCL
jgi:hypothetical protein